MISGVGVGEGLAAVCGYQCGDEGTAVAMPTFSREIKTIGMIRYGIPLPGANFAFAVRLESAPYHERENT